MSFIYKLFEKAEYKSSKYKKYFEIYDELFEKFRGKDIKILEIGVQDGGSLKIWQSYFGKKSEIYGVDLNPDCKKFESGNIKIFIGSQSNDDFWREIFKKIGKVDIIIDDGGHTNLQQIKTVINCVPNINDNGLIVIEDVHSSYLKRFNNPSKYSFINFVKKTIDDLNYTYPNLNKFNYSLNQLVYSIQVYESITVFYVDRNKCETNEIITNKGKKFFHIDYRQKDKDINFFFIKKIQNRIIKKIIEKFEYLKIKKYFE